MVVWSRWLARHPVKVEIAGSSPVTTAASRRTRVAQWQSARPTSGRSQAHFLPRVPRSCGETEIMPDYGSGGEGSSPSGSAQRPVAHLAERPHAAEAAGSTPAGPTGAWTQKARGPAVTRVLAGAVPVRHPRPPRTGAREIRASRPQAPMGELIMWREHLAVNQSLRLCRFDSCLAHCSRRTPAVAAQLPGSGICRRASEARSSQFDSGQGDARRMARYPPGG
jgi:hypothetical protein